ncbi:MAG: PhzF family phenazine biosynthesis protein [Acidimicrobiales bacterium]
MLEAPAPGSWMQSVAAEVNVAETAFLVPRRRRLQGLRWFTPTVEGRPLRPRDDARERPRCSAASSRSTPFRASSGAPRRGRAIALDLPGTAPQPLDADLGADWARPSACPPMPSSQSARARMVARRGGDGRRRHRPRRGPDGPRRPRRPRHRRGRCDNDPTAEVDSVCRTFAPAAGIDEDR